MRLSLSKVRKSLVLAVAMVAGTSAIAQRPYGIDVSSFQGGSLNWTNIKNSGIAFAWAKATEGNTNYYFDADFTINEQHAVAAGVLIGAYHFARYDRDQGTNGAAQEAGWFWQKASPYINASGGYIMPMLDVEETNTTGYTRTTLSQWVNAWCQTITNLAAQSGVTVTPVIYCSPSYASTWFDNTVSQWIPWIANWNGQSPQTGGPSPTTPWPNWVAWQWDDKNLTFTNFTTNCDVDVFNGNAAQLTNTLVIGQAIPINVTAYWDPGLSGVAPGSGGNGTWSTNNSNWVQNGSGDVLWSLAGDDAVFAGTPGTVTLGANMVADSITFSNGGYTLAGSSALLLTGAGNIYLPPGTTNSITCIFGGVGYTLFGGGTLNLNNAGNYCNGETVIGPNTTLQLPTDHPAGNDNVTMNLSNGGIYQDLDSTSGDQFLLPGCSMNLQTGGGIVENPNANLTMSNLISGSGSLTYIGTTHTLTLTDTANSYSGGTIVQSGTLKANAAHTLGSSSGSVTVYGGTLDLGAASHTAGAVAITNGTIQNGTLTGTSYAGQAGTISANLAGSGAFTKSTSGTLTLSGTNTFTGKTTIQSGLLQVSSDTNFGTAPASSLSNSITISSGTNSNYGIRAQSASFTLNSNRGIFLNGGGQVQVAQNLTLTYNGIISGNGGFMSGTSTTVGYGTIVLGGLNTYSGPTIIAAGTLQLATNNALPSGTPLTIAAANAVGGVFNMNGKSQTIGPLASSPGIGSTGTNTPTLNLTGALTILETNNSEFDGVINGSGGSFTLGGSNTLTLNGMNTYTGGTTIAAGTLALGASGSINKTASISIGAGGTFDCSAIAAYSAGTNTTLIASGTVTPATINGAAGGTVNLGNQSLILNYDGSHPALIIAQGTLVLSNNPFTINCPALSAGTYTLIHQASGNVASSGNLSVQVPGGTTSGTIVVSNGDVNLIAQPIGRFTNLIALSTVTYGTSNITLTGTVVGTGPTYPAMGEAIAVTIGTNTQNTTMNDSTGDFSIIYNCTGFAYSNVPYAISYTYPGDNLLSGSTDVSTALQVNQRPVVLSGTRPYDGTAVAAAGILSVTNSVGNDIVSVASGSGTLASANVGPESITSFGNLTLGGAAATNYTLAGASGSVVITAPPFSISSTGVDLTGSNIVITWQSAPGATYQVLGSPDLLNWTNVGSPIVATTTVTSATNAINAAANFFSVTGH